jgi:hypothetical protein
MAREKDWFVRTVTEASERVERWPEWRRTMETTQSNGSADVTYPERNKTHAVPDDEQSS